MVKLTCGIWLSLLDIFSEPSLICTALLLTVTVRLLMLRRLPYRPAVRGHLEDTAPDHIGHFHAVDVEMIVDMNFRRAAPAHGAVHGRGRVAAGGIN